MDSNTQTDKLKRRILENGVTNFSFLTKKNEKMKKTKNKNIFKRDGQQRNDLCT